MLIDAWWGAHRGCSGEMELPSMLRTQHLMHWGGPASAPPRTPPAHARRAPHSPEREVMPGGGALAKVRAGVRGAHRGGGVADRATHSARKPIIIPHADGADHDDDGLNYLGHMLAGSVAGMSEHAFMFPADTVKTRMQVSAQRQQPRYTSVVAALRTILSSEGLSGLYRGVGAVVLGAIPGTPRIIILNYTYHRCGPRHDLRYTPK